MQRYFLMLLLLAVSKLFAQADPDVFLIEVVNEKNQPAVGVSVELLAAADSSLLKTAVTDSKGYASFSHVNNGSYLVKLSHDGYGIMQTKIFKLPGDGLVQQINLKPYSKTLQDVKVTAARPFIQQLRGKLVVNVDAAVTNSGTTVLELLEKSPGVLIDKNGTISLQAKPGVLVMIDDKPTYLGGTDLLNMLSGMSSSQVDQVELITNPSARFEAAGNGGIINIKTKKNKQQGFNGTLTLSAGHGRYYKNSNSLLLNFRREKFNSFLNCSNNNNKYYTDIYALRTYFKPDGSILSVLDQPSYFYGTINSNVLKTGVDYFVSDNTTLGIILTGAATKRSSLSDATATWLNAAGGLDSTIQTNSKSRYYLHNGALNFYIKQRINSLQDLSLDIDWIDYDINNVQAFYNMLVSAGGYNDASRGDLPARIKIFSAKADYVFRFNKDRQLEAGIKSAHTSTDNLAAYQYFNGNDWLDDYGKSNHFLYDESINALYSSLQQKFRNWSYQAGLRYENTRYTANQLGNILNKDSAFNKQYAALFPSGNISFAADSNHTLTFTASRRIDRPAFQKLNPFIFIINKYTQQQGNPFFRPQYSWNMELSHQFKQYLTTTISYSIIKDYFSQLFLSGGRDILIYAEGNVGRAYNLGFSMATQLSPRKWWSLTAQGIFNYKKLHGYVWNNYTSEIRQFNISMNNQFKINQTYTAELSGFYTGRARNDLQELLYPNSQVLIGLARPVLKKKGTLKMSMRDILYTLGMEGVTDFQSASEYFILRRDSRVLNLSFVYRFGKQLKPLKNNTGGAADEIQRAGS
jgi:hypothetical protein